MLLHNASPSRALSGQHTAYKFCISKLLDSVGVGSETAEMLKYHTPKGVPIEK